MAACRWHANGADKGVPTKFAKRWLRLRQIVEPVRQLAIEGLFRNVASGIERVECVGEAVVENGEMRNLLPKEIL